MNKTEYVSYLKAIEGRTNLNLDQRKELYINQTGLEGEMYFKAILDTIVDVKYVYNLEIGTSNHIQIDFLVVSSAKIYIFEVKHYTGDWYFEEDYIKCTNSLRYPSPHIQTNKIENKIQSIVNTHNLPREVETIIIFTNSHFNLHGKRPQNQAILLPQELSRVPQLIDTNNQEANQEILNIFKQYESIHSTFYQKDINILEDKVGSGLRCPNCRKLFTIAFKKNKHNYRCCYCRKDLGYEELIYFNLKELFIIKRKPFDFKEAKAWCYPIPIHTVRRVCNKYFKNTNMRNKKFYLEKS
ncbi:nuclease-related domain-containing protein [Mammaliicoccus sciuri]|uniref:nuclease-related domain-containing protein n=1 Tax=Mammaliicoccus sciuri TaxID=1296 RepID=UPI003F57FD2C